MAHQLLRPFTHRIRTGAAKQAARDFRASGDLSKLTKQEESYEKKEIVYKTDKHQLGGGRSRPPDAKHECTSDIVQ